MHASRVALGARGEGRIVDNLVGPDALLSIAVKEPHRDLVLAALGASADGAAVVEFVRRDARRRLHALDELNRLLPLPRLVASKYGLRVGDGDRLVAAIGR